MKSDWDLGQALIERGFCSLDQVREAIAIQDQMKKMGIVPKPLPQILLEKGYVTAAQLSQLAVSTLVEKGYRPVAARRPARRRSAVPFFAFMGILAAGALVVFLVIQVVNRPREREVPRPAGPDPTAAEEQRLDEELEAIGAFAGSAADFENAAEVLRRYEAFVKKIAGRRWEIEAHRRLKDYRDRLEAFARPAFEEIRRREPELRADGRLAELHALYKTFPARFLGVTESGRSAGERLDEIARQMEETFVREREAAERLAREGRTEEALGHVQAMERVAAPERLADVGGLRARIEQEGRTRAKRVRSEVADRYLALDGAFKGAMARRSPHAAALAVWGFLEMPWKDEERVFVRAAGVDYEALKKAVEAWEPEKVLAICEPAVPNETDLEKVPPSAAVLLDLRNAALVGLFLKEMQASYEAAIAGKETLELPTLGRGRFERRENRAVFVTASGRLAEGSLSEDDLAYLVLRRAAPDASVHARVGFFYYYAAKDLHAKAYHHLQKADEMGARGVRIFLASLAVVARAEMERAVEAKFGAARECVERRQWVPARALLEELREKFADHPVAVKNRKSIDEMLYTVARALSDEKRFSELYHGKVEALAGGAVRVTYDFEDKAQADAFELVFDEDGRKFKGRWRIERGAMESGYETSVLRWKGSFRGDLAVDYELTALEDPQNIVTNLYYKKGTGRHYSVVFGFDWVGRSDGDAANTAEDRFGMPRTCVIKYPVLVDKGRWMLSDHWLNWTTRLVGKAPGSPWKPAKSKPAKIRIVRQGKSLAVHADGVPIWEGEDDAYTEGQLLFFTDCRCRIDNLVITFTPQP